MNTNGLKLSLKSGEGGGFTLPSLGTNAPKGKATPGAVPLGAMSQFAKYVDPSGNLNFTGKAVLHGQGVDFSSGSSYKINLEQMHIKEEIGRGQFGVVTKVFHDPTNVTMAMKQIRLEISESAFKQIITELEILHKASSPNIVEFYGAFFVESCVYYCMEYMDAGSLENLYGPGLPEGALAIVARGVVDGLHFLKEELSIIHRDVKPTNILLSLSGDVKLCDFGVSGQLIKSLAKTNIGCQSYMAPERIAVGNDDVLSYTVSADIWSLGLTLWEAAMGGHPFPTEEYDSVFAQLNAIVNETVPKLDTARFSPKCQAFIDHCLSKDPSLRSNYLGLLKDPFINEIEPFDMSGWVKGAHERFLAKKEHK